MKDSLKIILVAQFICGLAICSQYTISEGIANRFAQITKYDHNVHHNSISNVEL